jgi:hypothetical protein
MKNGELNQVKLNKLQTLKIQHGVIKEEQQLVRESGIFRNL